MSFYRDINLSTGKIPKEINVHVDRSSPDIKIALATGGSGAGGCRMLVKTTEEWEATPTFVPGKHDIIVYSDYYKNEDGSVAPRIKIGDGTTYLVDLLWTDGNVVDQVDEVMQKLNDHIADTDSHLTPDERSFWNNKLNYNISEGTETLVLNRN